MTASVTGSRPDPLIDEVRERRRELFEALGCDFDRYIEAIRELEAQHPPKLGDPRRAKRTRNVPTT